jgi:hypothetical protein
MASNIDTFLRDPGTPSQILVLSGNYHVAHDFALPDKIRQKGSWTVRSLITIPANRHLREGLDFTANNPETPSLIAGLIGWVEPK